MPHLGTETDYRKLADDSGFTCEKVQDVSGQVASTWPRIAGIFLGKLIRNPRYVRFLCNRHARNRVFAVTVFRLWFAFRSGAMRYGVFTFVKASS
jgi:tocopherol O-methyltransferase